MDLLANPFVAVRGGARGATPARLLAAVSLTAALAFGAAACGGGSDADGAPMETAANGTRAPSAERGEQLAQSSGCAGCHGSSFGGGAAPGWIGLAGAEVTLADGSTVIADDTYLTRAIANPGADLVAGYTLQMPRNSLSDGEIADIVAYIKTLAEQ